MRTLVLLTDAFGGCGGIALYNRDLITALCSHPECSEVVAIPRLMPRTSEPLPDKLTYVTGGLDNKCRYITAVWRTVRENPTFDLIICGHINLLPLAFALKIWLRRPLVLEIYGIDAWHPPGNTLTRMLIKKIDAFVSISDITKKSFLSWAGLPEEKGFLLPNAIHLECYGPSPKAQSLLKRYGLESKTVIMTMGRLVAKEGYKGFDEVLDLLPELSRELPGIAYLIVGDGDDRIRLEQKAQELGVADKVLFTGYIYEEEKADHFNLADVYVMPSRGEGFGFVFLEAMACGVPVIASILDGGREALRDGLLGRLVDPGNRDEIKNALLSSLGEERGGVPLGLEYFSFHNFSRRLHLVLDEVLRKGCVQ